MRVDVQAELSAWHLPNTCATKTTFNLGVIGGGGNAAALLRSAVFILIIGKTTVTLDNNEIDSGLTITAAPMSGTQARLSFSMETWTQVCRPFC
jgi:hypothetical protein